MFCPASNLCPTILFCSQEKLEKKFDAVASRVSQASPGRDERQAKLEALEAEVSWAVDVAGSRNVNMAV